MKEHGKLFTISIVSHGHLAMISRLLDDISSHRESAFIDVILTLNISEDTSAIYGHLSRLHRLITNAEPKGFGENHNFAFSVSRTDYFVVANPDIRFVNISFSKLASAFESDASIGAISPLVKTTAGDLTDFARRYPSPFRVLSRLLASNARSNYQFQNSITFVDWVAGIFVTFRRPAFEMLNGFDTGYFMYLEDADICRRLNNLGWRTAVYAEDSVTHIGARESHRKLRYLFWHIKSFVRFFSR